MRHLLLAVTAHGYGHLAQSAPVVAELKYRYPKLRVTLQGDINPAYAARRLPPGYHQVPIAADVALPMDGPLSVRWAEGLALYETFEVGYEGHLAAQIGRLRADPPDLVLADIPWLPLDAARRLGIPAAGLCCLSWYDILRESPVGADMSPALTRRLRDTYAGADVFLRAQPSMPMTWLPNARDIGPIATHRPRDPAALRRRLGLGASTRVVLMQFGGAGRLRLGGPRRLLPDLCLVTPDADAASERDDVRVLGPGDPDVLEVLASADALITKPGYGTFAEAACNGIPVLSVTRDDWPESPWLERWLADQVPLRRVAPAAFAAGDIVAALGELLATGPVQPIAADGVGAAADLLVGLTH